MHLTFLKLGQETKLQDIICWMQSRSRVIIQDNGALYILVKYYCLLLHQNAEAELRALFLNTKEGKITRVILHKLGHKQPPTLIHCDNVTAEDIANNTVKKYCSHSMQM